MTKKLRLWLAALVMGLGIAGQATATPYVVGNLDGPNLYFNSLQYGPSTSFSDSFTFDLTQGNSFVSIVQQIILSPSYGITGLTLHLVGPMIDQIYSPIGNFLSTGTMSLGAGTYVATVGGTTTGTQGGIYQIQMATTVPEPSEWMMMLAGLILVGFMVKRRSDLI
jgi:hypothetical protein